MAHDQDNINIDIYLNNAIKFQNYDLRMYDLFVNNE